MTTITDLDDFTRGFGGRGAKRDSRLSPGQYDNGNQWPVLTTEVTPRLDTAILSHSRPGLA
jgi:hypothetical protein